ncbi:NR2CA protein, partial [Pachyramphus minor]|nr:NR2CA protein [Pachyramphus minor]
CPHPAVPCRVSSVLKRDGKQFGKQHMFDGSEETCWISDQGTSQWVTLDFPHPVKVSQLHIQFHGGFSSQVCTLEGLPLPALFLGLFLVYSWFYPCFIPSWALQTFQVKETVLDRLKITFDCCTDFFGRIMVYHLGVLGERL